MKTVIRTVLTTLALTTLNFACTDDKKQIEDPIASLPDKKHDFSVDKDGKVVFKSEIVYFAFDDHTLTEEGMQRLNRLAEYMKTNSDRKLRIDGHSDERGSIEYNLALGQLRSQSVKAYLASLNVPENRLESVSFGEEKPAEEGHIETSWAKNRRAEFTFLN